MYENKVDWNAGSKFYDYLIFLEMEGAKERFKINDEAIKGDIQMVAFVLDNWLEFQREKWDTIHGYLKKEENKVMQDIEDKILKMTSGDFIGSSGLGSSELYEVMQLIRDLKRSISGFLCKYNMYIPRSTYDPGQLVSRA